MKFGNILMVLMILGATTMLYDGLFSAPPEDYCIGEECYENYTQSPYSDNSSKVWKFIMNPSPWSGTSLMIVIIALGAAVGLFIVVGLVTRTPTDTVFFSPLFLLLLAAGFAPIVGLYYVITRDVGFYGCAIGGFCLPATIVWILTGGILSIFWVLAAIKWWRTGDA